MRYIFKNPVLKKMIDSRKLPSSIIIDGEDSLALAREIAYAAVCTGDIRPCGQCSACLKSAEGSHPDIALYEGAGTSRSFHIDVIRQIRADAYVLPNEAERKVYILSGAENLSDQAQNALLKILEEPPAYVLFILACSSKISLLPTVLSRSVAISSGGERQVDDDIKKIAEDIALAVTSVNELDLLKKIVAVGTDKLKFRAVILELLNIFRQVYLIKSGIKSDNDTAHRLNSEITLLEAVSLTETLRWPLEALERNANMNLVSTRLSAVLRNTAGL